ncbi:MAG: hypothetical protein WCT25_00035 [Candidatus Paceibacterota bacterium]
MATGIFFAHPHTLFSQVEKVLKRVGAQKFFTSPDEEVKKAREGFAAYFFTLTMKKHTGKDWWLAQYDQAERAYPDFDFISFGETPEKLGAESVELTGVYSHFKSFEEMAKVVEKKQKQYGDKPVKFSLLIFVNHEKSEEWINLLRERLTTEHPFISIWTIHLRFKKGGQEVGKAVAQRIRPLPGLRVEADTDDPKTHKRQPLLSYMEEKSENGTNYVIFRQEFIDKIMSFRGASK